MYPSLQELRDNSQKDQDNEKEQETWTPGNIWGYERLIFYEPVKCSAFKCLIHYFSRNKKYEILIKSCIPSNPVLLRIIVLCMISDQGEYCFVKKKKKRKHSDFIYLLSFSHWFPAQMQTLALSPALLFPYSLHR